MNLATAHLASPMTEASDQLRLGRGHPGAAGLPPGVHGREYPGPWSTATLNLANALVYTPSTHQGDNLVEAVELYEEVLVSGIRNNDPLGRARLLSNQGNALAHLGIFDEARAKLVEARFLFEEQLDHDSAMAVRSVLDEIAKSEIHDAERCRGHARGPRPPGRADGSDAPIRRAFTSGMGVRISEPGG